MSNQQKALTRVLEPLLMQRYDWPENRIEKYVTVVGLPTNWKTETMWKLWFHKVKLS